MKYVSTWCCTYQPGGVPVPCGQFQPAILLAVFKIFKAFRFFQNSQKMSDSSIKASEQWDNEYQETVLKVPDGLGVTEGDTTKKMVATGKVRYKVFCVILKMY